MSFPQFRRDETVSDTLALALVIPFSVLAQYRSISSFRRDSSALVGFAASSFKDLETPSFTSLSTLVAAGVAVESEPKYAEDKGCWEASTAETGTLSGGL